MVEDINQHQHTIMYHMEDEEVKYYDRITLKFKFSILMGLRFPKQVYNEGLAENIDCTEFLISNVQDVLI